MTLTHKNIFRVLRYRSFFVSMVFLFTLLPLGFLENSLSDLYSLAPKFLATNAMAAFFYALSVAILTRIPIVQRALQGITYLAMHKLTTRVFLSIIFFAFLAITISTSYRVFHFYPSIIDSIAQYIQAKMLIFGYTTFALHPLQNFFSLENFIEDGRFYSQYPPGHMLLLALGLLAGIPWFVNPLLGAMSCVLLYLLARDIFNEKVARITALLFLLSPFVRVMSSEYMNHSTTLFCVTLFTLCFVRGTRTGNGWYGLLAGISIGYAFITRPYTALAYALPIAVYGLWLFYKKPTYLWKCYFSIVLGFLPIAAIQLVYNYATTGNPFLYGYIKLYGEEHMPGFHAVPAHFVIMVKATQHTVLHGLKQSFSGLNGIQIFLFAWPVPSLVFAAVAYVLYRRKTTPYLYVFLTIGMTSWLATVTYFYGDWCFGPRYYYEISGLLIILTAYGLAQVPLFLRVIFNFKQKARIVYQWLALGIGACAVGSIFTGSILVVNCEYCWAPTPVIPIFQKHTLHHALIFVDAEKRDYQDLAAYYYPIQDSNGIIIAHDLGDKENQKLMDYYPDRTVYRWVYKSEKLDRSQLGWFSTNYNDESLFQSLSLLRNPLH